MIPVDANLLICAVDSESPHHVRASVWFADLLSRTTPVALGWLAALAIEHGCPIYSTDHDFKWFPGVEHINPLA